MKSHPPDIPHPWTFAESPHMPDLDDIKKSISAAPIQPPQAVPPSYPDIEPYPSEASPLLHRAKEEGWREWRVLNLLRRKTAGFFNPPMLGGIAAITAGVIPFLHSWLFDQDAILSP